MCNPFRLANCYFVTNFYWFIFPSSFWWNRIHCGKNAFVFQWKCFYTFTKEVPRSIRNNKKIEYNRFIIPLIYINLLLYSVSLHLVFHDKRKKYENLVNFRRNSTRLLYNKHTHPETHRHFNRIMFHFDFIGDTALRIEKLVWLIP